MASLSDVSIIAWMREHNIVNEKGEPLNFHDHPFLYDIYRDFSPVQVLMKPAQIGASTMMNVKPFFIMDKIGLDIIYTLPSDADVSDFVGSKTNRMIAQNPYLLELTKDRDTVEQKAVNKSIIYFRGTWTKKAAMMVPSDLNIHDEVDASKQEVLADYETRLKHSKYKWRWYFSHPSIEGTGVHKMYLDTDQKNWFINCGQCKYEQVLTWPESIDRSIGRYVCKKCKQPLQDDDRRRGTWKPTNNNLAKNNFGRSGYWVSSLMCPWVPATEIIEAYETKDPEYFTTKVLGLPYSGGGTKVSREVLLQNLTKHTNSQSGRIVIGVDTGIKIHYVVGNNEGLFFHDETNGYDAIEALMDRYRDAVVVIDQGGDLISPRKLRDKYPGRVFLCYFRQDRKAMQLVAWGEGVEDGKVICDRNRTIQLVVDELTDKRIPIQGTEDDWKMFIDHFLNIYRVKTESALGVDVYKWERKGPDHLALATVYWRVGMTKFSQGNGTVLGNSQMLIPTSRGFIPTQSGGQKVSEIKTYMFPEREETEEEEF